VLAGGISYKSSYPYLGGFIVKPKDAAGTNLSRRAFIRNTAAGAATIAGASLLQESQASAAIAANSQSKAISSLTPKEALETEVLVVGAGTAGLAAAVSAAQSGAKVVLIEKSPTYTALGGDNTAIGSRLQKKLGIEIDRDEVVRSLMRWGGNKPDARLIRLWAANCGKVMDWLMDMAEAAGLRTALYIPTTLDANAALIDKWPNPTGFPASWNFRSEFPIEYPTAHRWNEGANQRLLLGVLEKNALKNSVKIFYSTRASQLLAGARRRITGVLAETEAGDYVQINANKAVLLCTGDYGSNPDMMRQYCPQAADLANSKANLKRTLNVPFNTGDGHRMAMQMGAVMELGPHAPMAHMFHVMGTDAFLRVNKFGERYENEDVDTQSIANQCLQQNGYWVIFDESWPEDIPQMGLGFRRIWRADASTRKDFETRLKSGRILKADTIAELGAKMKVPEKTFRATIDRYNALASQGKDLDFGKRADRLTAIDQPPFYAGWSDTPDFLAVMGGLIVNPRLQPLDAKGKVIEGLYLAGNTVGRRFANDYPVMLPGLSHSMAWTHGFLAGKYAAEELA
jgi:fumarate reductase flavoprotein subunit